MYNSGQEIDRCFTTSIPLTNTVSSAQYLINLTQCTASHEIFSFLFPKKCSSTDLNLMLNMPFFFFLIQCNQNIWWLCFGFCFVLFSLHWSSIKCDGFFWKYPPALGHKEKPGWKCSLASQQRSQSKHSQLQYDGPFAHGSSVPAQWNCEGRSKVCLNAHIWWVAQAAEHQGLVDICHITSCAFFSK